MPRGQEVRLQNVLFDAQLEGAPIRSSDWIGRFTKGGTRTGTARAEAYWNNLLQNAGF